MEGRRHRCERLLRLYGQPTNAELVSRVVEMAAAAGREPATPDETLAILGVSP